MGFDVFTLACARDGEIAIPVAITHVSGGNMLFNCDPGKTVRRVVLVTKLLVSTESNYVEKYGKIIHVV